MAHYFGEIDLSTLDDATFEALLAIAKLLLSASKTILLPEFGNALQLALDSVDEQLHFKFAIDVNRKASKKKNKCSYQLRIEKHILLRLDINCGRMHTNPPAFGGETIAGDHLHIFKEGYGVKVAYPVPTDFQSLQNLATTLRDFMIYSNVDNLEGFEFLEQTELI